MYLKSKLFRIGQIAGIFYSNGEKCKTIIVYGLGAPTLPDNGTLPDATHILKYGVDLFVPDYIGYGRSSGVFTPQNCIMTFLSLYKSFKQGCVGHNYYETIKKRFKYKNILFIGRSLGGAYVPLLPKYNSEINKLCLLYPAVNQKAQGQIKGEETNDDFLRSIKEDGYHYLYRGLLENKKIWIKHLNNKDGLSPIDNIQYLKDSFLFIGHGLKDKCIHYSKSKDYYQKIIQTFPGKKVQFKLGLYSTGNHGPSTSNLAVEDFLKWIL